MLSNKSPLGRKTFLWNVGWVLREAACLPGRWLVTQRLSERSPKHWNLAEMGSGSQCERQVGGTTALHLLLPGAEDLRPRLPAAALKLGSTEPLAGLRVLAPPQEAAGRPYSCDGWSLGVARAPVASDGRPLNQDLHLTTSPGDPCSQLCCELRPSAGPLLLIFKRCLFIKKQMCSFMVHPPSWNLRVH